MRPQTVTQTGAGASSLIVPDKNRNPFVLGLYAVVADTVTDYNIEYTGDDVQAAGYDPDTGNWFSAIDAASASAAQKFDTPCTALRINIVTGTGSVTLTVHQAGHGPGG
jgi:hypothetical protein